MAANQLNVGAKLLKSLTGYVHCGVLMEMKGKKYSYCFVVISKGANDIRLYCFENQFSSKAHYVLCMNELLNTEYYKCEKEVTVGFKILFQDVKKSPRIYICSHEKESLEWIMEINKAINNSYVVSNIEQYCFEVGSTRDSGFGSASSAGKSTDDDLLQLQEGPYSNVRADGSFSSIAPDHGLSVPEEHDYERTSQSRSIRNKEESSAPQLEQLDTRKPLPIPRHDVHANKGPKAGAGVPLASKLERAISEDVLPDTLKYMQLETEQNVSKEEVLHTSSDIKPETEGVLMRSNTGERETDRRRAKMLPEDPCTVTDSGVKDEPVTTPDISSNNKRGSSGSSFESVRSGASDHDMASD